MAYSFHLIAPLKLIVFQPRGILTEADVLDYFTQARAHPDFQPGLNRLVDNKALEDVAVTFDEMRNIQANERQHPARVQTAFITYGDNGYGMARMYASIADGRDTQNVALFDQPADSAAFLGLSAVDLQAALDALPPY